MDYEFLYWPEADDALAKLENDHEMAAVLQAVERTLDRLEADPFSPRLGTTAFMTSELGGINATPARIDDWYIVWQRGEPGEIEIVAIHQIPL